MGGALTEGPLDTEAFLERVWRLTLPELGRLQATDEQSTFVARSLARRTAARVARDVHRLKRLQEVQGLLRDWATSAGPAHPYQADYLRHRDELDARGRCLNVLLDAATASVLADVLSADEVQALWGPWEAFSLPPG